MCGIAGAYEFGGRRPVNRDRARRMLEVIAHRGPDDHGMYFADGLAIGNRRLSIIDLAGGHQPIANEDGTVVVVFNGEIYNYRELRRFLQARGHIFRTQSDTEAIVHLYEELGEDCLSKLRGMFALAIWDARCRRLFLARDRVGIKPLYYAVRDRQLLFGSEIKALLPYRDESVRADLDALAAFLLLKYVPAPATLFEGVSALPPGHALACDEHGIRIRRWWDVSFQRTDDGLDERLASERLAALLRDAVSSHLVSDVPFGAFLSGGIDSSTVVALMSQVLSHPVKTFAVGFEGPGQDMSELPYARMVADRYETDHHEVLVGANDFVALAERVVWHLDQPIADNACLANYMVAAFAANYVKMVLTGEGGDELFAGYARYAGERFAPLFRALPAPLHAVGRSVSTHRSGLSRPRIALHALCHPSEAARFAAWFPLMHPEARAQLASGPLTDALPRADPERLFSSKLDDTDATESINRMLYVDTKLWLPDDLLARGDKTSMAASLEARVPLLDHHLVEFAAGLPPRFKVHGLERKYLLKRVARELLPREILSRRKKGFPIPICQWLRAGARDFCRDLLAPETLRRRGLFDPAAVDLLLRQHDAAQADHSSVLWALISIELWHTLYVDRADSAIPDSVASAAA